MPYISLAERTKFAVPIRDVLAVLADPTDTPYVKGEYFGYVFNRIVKKFLGDPNYVQTSFNSTFFNEGKKKALSNAADSLAVYINRADPIHSAGELHYVLSALYQGFLGFAKGFESAPYGLQAYLRGVIERVLSTVETVNVGNQRDMAMTFRRHLIIRGVLDDVLNSISGRHTHDDKIWDEHGELTVAPVTTALAQQE